MLKCSDISLNSYYNDIIIMSYIISANLEPDVHAWLMQEQNRSQSKNLSKVVNFFLREAMERRKKETPQMLECPKHPGSTYSSRLSECPLCAEARTMAEIEARDSLIVYERKRLADEIATKQLEITMVTNAINALDPETAEEGKRDQLNKSFDELSADLRQLKAKLQELV